MADKELHDEVLEEMKDGNMNDNAAEDKVEEASEKSVEKAKSDADNADTKESEETEANTDSKKDKDSKDIKIDELQDLVKRQMAEFDNFRKRTEKEKSAMYEIGAKSIIEKILPVVDNFERGLAGVAEKDLENPFVNGIEKVYKQLISGLEEIGVTQIEAINQEFNPELHNAVMHIEDDEVGENMVVEEFQKGYKYRENVVRHSMVKVAN